MNQGIVNELIWRVRSGGRRRAMGPKTLSPEGKGGGWGSLGFHGVRTAIPAKATRGQAAGQLGGKLTAQKLMMLVWSVGSRIMMM